MLVMLVGMMMMTMMMMAMMPRVLMMLTMLHDDGVVDVDDAAGAEDVDDANGDSGDEAHDDDDEDGHDGEQLSIMTWTAMQQLWFCQSALQAGPGVLVLHTAGLCNTQLQLWFRICVGNWHTGFTVISESVVRAPAFELRVETVSWKYPKASLQCFSQDAAKLRAHFLNNRPTCRWHGRSSQVDLG